MKDTNALIEELKQHCCGELRLQELDMELLRLSVRKSLSSAELSAHFETVVFDNLQGQQVCALASISQKLGYQGVPGHLVPRVKGALRYYSARDAMQMKEFCALIQKLNETGSEVTLLNGAAMKVYYRPDTLRYTADLRLRIRHSGPGSVLRALEETGEYSIRPDAGQTATLEKRQNPGIRFVCRLECSPESVPDRDFSLKDAAKTSFHGEQVFIPPRETLLVMILSDVFQSVLRGNGIHSGRMQWAQDCAFLIEEDDFDWRKVPELCRLQETSAEILIMLKILNDLFPSLVPEDAFPLMTLRDSDDRRILLFRRLLHVKENFSSYRQASAGKNRSLRYCCRLLELYWYKNRCLGKGSFPADVLSFPSYLKSGLQIKTWKDFAGLLSTKLREPI